MRYARRQRVQQPFHGELFPIGMLKGDQFDAPAKALEHRSILHPLTTFRQGNQIHFVITGQMAQQLKSAMIRTAIQRIRDVRVNNQDLHATGFS